MKIIKKIKLLPKIEIIFLLILVIFSVYGSVENYIFIKKDNTPFITDMVMMYEISKIKYNRIKEQQISSFISEFDELVYPTYTEAPVTILQPIPFYFIFGVSEDTATFSNIIHLFILLFSVYFIGRKIRNPYTGFLSALVLFFIPATLPFSRSYIYIFALASFVTLSLCLFLYSDFFKKRNISIFLGLSIGLGMLTKPLFIFYFLPISSIFLIKYILYRRRCNARLFTKKQIINLCLSFFITLTLILSWYPNNMSYLEDMSERLRDYHSRSDFYGLSFFESSLKILYEYFYEFGYKIVLKIYLIPLILYSLYLSIRLFRKKSREGSIVKIEDLMIGTYLVFIPLLFSKTFPVTLLFSKAFHRYLIPLIPFFSIIIGDSFFTIISFIKLNIIKKMNFNLLFSIFILSLLLIMIIYNNDLKEIEKERIPYYSRQVYYVYGMIIPQKRSITPINLTIQIKDLLIRTNSTRILSLQASEIIWLVLHELRAKNYAVSEHIYCLTTPDKRDHYSACGIPKNITRDFVCNYDLIIDSDKYIDSNDYRVLEQSFPELLDTAKNILSTWKNCLNNYTLAKTITDVPFERQENSTLYIYVKK